MSGSGQQQGTVGGSTAEKGGNRKGDCAEEERERERVGDDRGMRDTEGLRKSSRQHQCGKQITTDVHGAADTDWKTRAVVGRPAP